MLSFQQYINRSSNERLLEQIARNMVISGSPIEDTFQFLPLPLNEGFFKRLGAAWRAFWNPDQETYTKDQVAQEVLRQNQEMMAQLQMIQEMLRKKGIEDGEIRKMFEKMGKHYAGIVGDVADTLDHGDRIDAAMAARGGKRTPGGTYTLPKDVGEAWDALQKIPPMDRSSALDAWWAAMGDPEKDNVRAALGITYSNALVTGGKLSVRMKEARAAGKI